jgi:acyl carrier protein
MCEDMFKKVESSVLKFWPPSKKPLSEDTRLLHDLGMDGTDAVEFMEAFSEEFNVDMSEFKFDRHFGPECGPSLTNTNAINSLSFANSRFRNKFGMT